MNKLRLSLLAVMFTVLGIIGAKAQDVTISVPEGLAGDPGETLSVDVYIDNKLDGLELVAWQIDVKIPDSFAFKTNKKGDKPSMTLDTEVNADGAILGCSFPNAEDKTLARALCYNNDNYTMEALAGRIMTFQVILPETGGEYQLSLCGIEVTTEELIGIDLPDVDFTVSVTLGEIANLEQYDADIEAIEAAKTEYEAMLQHYEDEGYSKYIDPVAKEDVEAAFTNLTEMVESAKAEAETTREYNCPDFEDALARVNQQVEDLWEAMWAAYGKVQEEVEEILTPAFDALAYCREILSDLQNNYEGFVTEAEIENLEAKIDNFEYNVLTPIYYEGLAGEAITCPTEEADALVAELELAQTAAFHAKLDKMEADYKADVDLLAEVEKTVHAGIAALNENYPAYVDAATEAALLEQLSTCADLIAANKEALDNTNEYQSIAEEIQKVADDYDEYELNVLTEVNDIMEAADDAADEYRAKIEDLTNEVDALADKYYAADVNAEAVESIKAEIAALGAEVESAIDTAVADKAAYVAPDESKFEAIAAEIKAVADDAAKAWADNAVAIYEADINDIAAALKGAAIDYAGYYDEAEYASLNARLDSCQKHLQDLYEAALSGDLDTYAEVEDFLGEEVRDLVMAYRSFIVEAAEAKNDAQKEAYNADLAAVNDLKTYAEDEMALVLPAYADAEKAEAIMAEIEAIAADVDKAYEAYKETGTYTSPAGDRVAAAYKMVDEYVEAALVAENDAYERAYDASLADRNAVEEMTAQLAAAAETYAGKYDEAELAAIQQALLDAGQKIKDAFNYAVDNNTEYVGLTKAELDDLQNAVDAFIAKAAQTTGLQLSIAEGLRISGRTLYNAAAQNIAVYTASGTLVYMGTDTTVTLPAKGIYVVKCGNKAIKANVR